MRTTSLNRSRLFRCLRQTRYLCKKFVGFPLTKVLLLVEFGCPTFKIIVFSLRRKVKFFLKYVYTLSSDYCQLLYFYTSQVTYYSNTPRASPTVDNPFDNPLIFNVIVGGLLFPLEDRRDYRNIRQYRTKDKTCESRYKILH